MAPVFLAPEIIERIIYFVTHHHPPSSRPGYWERLPDAGQYASVNRFWQDVIERETFASLRLNLSKLSQLNSIVTPRRRQFVRELNLYIQLRPGPRDDPETEDEKLQNNQVLQATLEAFLLALGQWTAAEVHQSGIMLEYYAPLPREKRPRSPMRRTRARAWERRYKESVLELTDPERIAQLPPAVVITKLPKYYASGQRRISVLAISALLAKLPAVKDVKIDFWKSLRFARMRNDLADALPQIKHPIDKFVLRDPIYRNGWFPLDSEIWEEDRLSKSIHVLSQRAKEVELDYIAVNDEIFYPRALSLSASLEEPRWDRLVQFTVNYLPIDPSGELLFLQDPSEPEHSDSEKDSLLDFLLGSDFTERFDGRLNIATPAIQKLYLSAARAALQMPALREMELTAALECGDYWHKFRYLATEGSAKATWTTSSGFVPEDDVLECWRKVPRKHMNLELEVELSDDHYALSGPFG
ncbi:hypothetical protein ACHAQJ_005371 [Trichoderma viride]